MSNTSYYELTHLGVLQATGADTSGFLQGQLTNDIRDLDNGTSQLGAYCSHKGRMIAIMRLLKQGDNILMLLPPERIEPVSTRLRMFVLMSKVELANISDTSRTIGLTGEAAATLLGDEAPAEIDAVTCADDGVCIIRIASGNDVPRFMLTGSNSALDNRISQFGDDVVEKGELNEWLLQDIRAGLPMVFEQTVEAFVPQMANMHLVNGVSFTKGCYTGQEVVARMQYLGSLKRRMYRVAIDADCPAPGTGLHAPGSKSAQGAGKVMLAAATPEGNCEALIVTEIASADEGSVHLVDDNGPLLHFLDLPYAWKETVST
jgi:folate-binding protein YgfZ